MFGGYDGVHRMNDFFEFRLGASVGVCRCTPVLIALTYMPWRRIVCRHVHVVTNSHSWEASEPTLLPLVCILWKVRWVDAAAAVAVRRFQLTVWYCAPAPAACTHSVATTGPNG